MLLFYHVFTDKRKKTAAVEAAVLVIILPACIYLHRHVENAAYSWELNQS